MIEAFRLLNKRSDLPSILDMEHGRKRSESKNGVKVTLKQLESVEDKQTSKRQPRTPPPTDAVGRLQRLGRMPEWELRILEPDIRSDWEVTERRRCLLINKKYCLYEERDGDDLYIAETAALQLARPDNDEKIPLEE